MKCFSQIWLHTRYERRKNTQSFYILGYLLETYHKNLAMWIFFWSKSGELGEKGRNHILQVEIWRIFDKKKNDTDVSVTVSLTD
jgi:hypothetical protein